MQNVTMRRWQTRPGGPLCHLPSLLAALIVGVCVPAVASEPSEQPTLIKVPIGGGRPAVQGERPPPPDARLGGDAAREQAEAARKAAEAKRIAAERKKKEAADAAAKDAATKAAAAKAAAAKTAAARAAAAKSAAQAERRRADAERAREAARLRAETAAVAGRTMVVMLDAGWVTVPRAFVDALSDREMHPELVGVGFDISLLRPATARHHYGGRIGLAVPLVPAANWYSADGKPSPRYTEVDAVLIDLAFEYVYRRKLFGPVGAMFRGGLGMGIIAGDVQRIETLPICPDDNQATCPHWRKVGQQDAPLPSRIWPSVHVSVGLTVDLGSSMGLHVDAGLRDAPYVGGGLSLAL